MIAVEENEGLDYMDSQLTNVMNSGRNPSINNTNS